MKASRTPKHPEKLPANVVRLVHSSETVNAKVNQDALLRAQGLLAEVLAGRIDGFVYVAMSSSSSVYRGDIAGTANDKPIFMRGLLRELDDNLARLT